MLPYILGEHPSLSSCLYLLKREVLTGAALCILCLAFFNPGVSWNAKNNPEPWNKLGPDDQYKFYSVNVDDSKRKKEGPDFQMECFAIKLLRMKVSQNPSAKVST